MRQQKNKIYIILGIMVFIVLMIFIISYFIKNKSSNTKEDLKGFSQSSESGADFNTSTENKSAGTTILPLNYYMEQPETNFKTYIRPEKVKGIFVSGPRAGSTTYMPDLIRIANETEINSMVIDIKNDNGEVTYKMNIPAVTEIEAGKNYIRDINELMNTLRENNIYPIARIVAFKDPYLSEKRPDLTIKNKDGSIWRDNKGIAWVNPYNKDVWEYIIDISKEAAAVGFKEIQFDYIRFSTDSRMKDADFGALALQKTRTDIINEFTKYAYGQLSPLGVYVSADVYGTIIDSKIDSDIVGQDYIEMTKNLDYICPMVYPSHYANGSMGIQYPDLEPYGVIYNSMKTSEKVLSIINKDTQKAIVRPWLQDFTASWVKPYQVYGAKQIKEQVKAVYDAGLEEWILWNGSCNYTEDGLEKK